MEQLIRIAENNGQKAVSGFKIESQIDIQTEIRNKANEELRILNKLLKNTKTEIYGQLPPQRKLSNCRQMVLDFETVPILPASSNLILN